MKKIHLLFTYLILILILTSCNYFDNEPDLDIPTTTTKIIEPIKNGYLTENFEKIVKGDVSRGNLKYVEGLEGYGILYNYTILENGKVLRSNILTYDNNDGKIVHPDKGTIELWVKPLEDIQDDNDIHQFFRAVAFRINSFTFEVHKNRVIVWRDFKPCIRNIMRDTYIFNEGVWYKLTLTWKGSTTKFYINDEEIGKFSNKPIPFYPTNKDFIAVGGSVFVTDNLNIYPDSTIIDDNSIEDIVCPES